MANEKHFIILNQGTKAWNDWRDDNPEKQPNLERTDLREKNLISINLIGANLSKTNLSGQNLSKVNLTKTDLTTANLSNANLSGADLFMADLSNANLSNANLSGASLSVANLSGANLNGANLSLTEALNTNFSKSIFTAACLQDWHINNATNLNNVICDYIYLKANRQERRPHDSNKTFAPGDFTKLFQQILETVDLIFSNGIDWNVFLTSFSRLQIENDSRNLSIQAIEKKQDGAFVIRVNVPAEVDKAAIEKSFFCKYKKALEAKTKEYRQLLKAKNNEIEIYRQQSADLMEIVKLQASRPINVEAKAVAENQQKNVEVEMNVNEGSQVTSMVGKNIGDIHHYAPEQRQSLTEAAKEIQQLLYQLSQNNPTSTEEVTEAIHQEIKRNPTLKVRLKGALKAGGLEALKAIFNHPVFSIPAETVKGWLEAE